MPMPSCKKRLLLAAFAAVVLLVPGRALFADTLTYTFSGVGTGNMTGKNSFTDAAFTMTFVENTVNITPLDPGYFVYSNVSGTFATSGYSATVTGNAIEVNGNPSTGVGSFYTVFLFASDFSSIGISGDPALAGYALNAPFTTGVVNSPAAAAFSADYSVSGGGTINIASVDSLDFTVTSSAPPSVVPEPATWGLLVTGLAGLGAVRRRFVA